MAETPSFSIATDGARLPKDHINPHLTVEELISNRGNVPLSIEEIPGAHSALFKSNDLVHQVNLDEISAWNPDGYLVGIGAGSIFTLLKCFGAEAPLGLVMADVDPHVVIAARTMIKLLKQLPKSQFFDKFFHASSMNYTTEHVVPILASDQRLRQGIMTWKGAVESPMDAQRSPEEQEPHGAINVRDIIEEEYDRLQKMAQSGNMAACYTDFADADFIDGIISLPNFQAKRNVVHLTNMLDYRSPHGVRIPIENIQKLDGEKSTIFVSVPWTNFHNLQGKLGFENLLRFNRISPYELHSS